MLQSRAVRPTSRCGRRTIDRLGASANFASLRRHLIEASCWRSLVGIGEAQDRSQPAMPNGAQAIVLGSQIRKPPQGAAFELAERPAHATSAMLLRLAR